VIALCAALTVTTVPSKASGGSGSGGGGGGGTVVLARVTGYVTAIDYEHSLIAIGASYYGSGVLSVNSATKISFDTVNCSLAEIQVGDWADARYDFTTKIATKLTCSTLPTP
jgi:hypothetical protein